MRIRNNSQSVDHPDIVPENYDSTKLDLTDSVEMNEKRYMIEIYRNSIDNKALEISYGKKIPEPPKGLFKELSNKAIHETKKCGNNFTIFGFLTSIFPFLNWIRSYSISDNLIGDMIGGFTISILHIPQGLANGLLAGLSPINGLYVSFFPALVYTFMGSAAHTSLGTFSVMSIMVSEASSSIVDDGIGLALESNSTAQYTPLEVLTSLCLMSGILQLVMGFFHLGVLSVVFSDTLVSALNTAAAIHVASSQLQMLLDIKIDKIKTRYFKLIYEWISIVSHMDESNVISIGMGITSIIVLLTVKEYVEPKLREKFPKFQLPIPIDILVVIFATFISWILDLGNEQYGVDIVGDIETGFPSPQMPPIDLFPKVLMDAIVVSVVAYAMTLSLGQSFGMKHNYKIDANQELIALGSANVLSSFFFCFPCSPALSRTSVASRVGSKTQITGLVSCAVILIVLLFLGGIFFCLPKCILASIIIVALKNMFMQVKDFPKAWRISRLEGLSWLVTFMSVILLDVDLGLLIGILISLTFILVRLSMPISLVLGQLPNTELYVNLNQYSEAIELKGIKIFHFSSALFFINRNSFKANLYKKIFNVTKNISPASIMTENNKNLIKVHTLIIDCSPVSYIDSAGVGILEEVVRELESIDINVIFASCNHVMLDMFEKMKFYQKFSHNILIYASVHDAVVSNLSNNSLKIS